MNRVSRRASALVLLVFLLAGGLCFFVYEYYTALATLHSNEIKYADKSHFVWQHSQINAIDFCFHCLKNFELIILL